MNAKQSAVAVVAYRDIPADKENRRQPYRHFIATHVNKGREYKLREINTDGQG